MRASGIMVQTNFRTCVPYSTTVTKVLGYKSSIISAIISQHGRSLTACLHIYSLRLIDFYIYRDLIVHTHLYRLPTTAQSHFTNQSASTGIPIQL